MNIREVTPSDAENLINLIKEVESQSTYMLMGAGERKTTPEQQQRQLEQIEKQSNATVFVAEEEGNLVGYMFAIGGTANRTKHSAYLVIGILEQYRGRGIGTSLFKRLDEWALKNNLLRLELSVVTENEAGLALYKKSGFEIEGMKRQSLKIGQDFYDEYLMSKLL
ncbi:N-acetyltransferase [Anaerobacillus alkaliphilus]|uniref:N-acetyltransferase n=1 Tax=Anaerobacillus alkaliphilus TaxID=1548597 RepID=A0A4Q0VYV2_9BACI|nr:GNAT family protein [Anaerobacillus alkaliphilus]RXJ04552.1 N-acetyltransferase [Anaerobacillus alkaliphilus]